jgi:hypothetical protein
MWLELGVPKTDNVPSADTPPRVWLNMEHVVRVEITESGRLTARVITTKPGGSDLTIFYDEDAKTIKEFLNDTKTKKKK